MLVRSTLAFALCVILIFQIFSVTQFGITDSKNAFAQTSGSSPTSYTTYQNSNEGVSIEYPSDWKYSEKTQGQAMLTYFTPPNNSHTFLELSYDKTTDYTGTDQQILGELPQIIGILCSNASITKNGFTCSNFQYTTAIGKYHGAPSYVMHGKMTETLSDGTTREQDTVQFLIITQNSDYGIFATCTKDECGNYNDELTHIVNSLNIYSLKTTNDPNAAQVSSYNIPSWIKNTAKWWSQGAVTDDDFVKGIQYLIQQGVITVPTTQVSSQSSHAIPSWVKNSAKWWSEGQVGDSDFVKGIQYLVQNGIIVTQNNNNGNNASGILDGATFYTGPPPTPEMVTYTENGVTLSVLAIPREVLLYVTQDTSSDDINQIITGYGGTILSKIPAMGYYEVHVNDVSKFISDIRQKSFVMYAGPNFVLSPDQASPNFPNVMDFSKYKTGVDINAGAKDPNPSSKVVIAVIDNFNGCYVLKKGSHGCHVINEIQEKTPTLPIMAIQYDGTSDSDLTKDIASAIETARNNNQKIVINLSWGVKLRDDNGNVVPNEQEKYAKFIKSTLNMLNNQYVDDGNVIFVKSGGNDNIDVSKAIDQIKSDKNVGERFGKMYILSGQLDEDTQKPMEYVNKRGSNHGNGILFGDVTSDACPTGTSCTAPTIVAATAAIWNTKPELKSSDVRNGMINSAKNTGNYPVLSPQDALYSITKCLPSCPQLPYNPGKPSNSGTTSSGQQSTNTQTTNGNQPAAKYKTGEDYCQGTYGSKYHYDSSTNKCTSYGGYGSKESYCQGTYGSDYHYDSSQNLCVQSPGGTSSENNGGQTTTITPARDLSGHWSGSFSMKDTTSDGCTFSGSWEATVTQNGNDLSGSFSIVDSSSPDYPANDFCTLTPGTFSFAGGTVSSSSFQFDTSDGAFHVKGYFTSDLIHGNFNECYDESCASGSFSGSRG